MPKQPIIFLVEDSDDDAELTEMAFEQANITNPIVRVRDGVEALDYLLREGDGAGIDPEEGIAVVLLDLNLPRVDGHEVLARIRGDQRTRRLPVVILTSSNEERDRVAAYDGHANSFVQKPVDYDQFVAAAGQLGLYWMLLNQPPRGDWR